MKKDQIAKCKAHKVITIGKALPVLAAEHGVL